MHMGIDKARNQISAFCINHLVCLIQICFQIAVFHMGNHTSTYKYIRRIDFSRKHIYQSDVLYQKIAVDFPQRSL